MGDVVVIDGFRGIVTDIGMRTTKLMDDSIRDIKIINNSTIKTLTNQSRENSAVIAFDCRERDKEMLMYQVSRSLVGLVSDLNTTPPA